MVSFVEVETKAFSEGSTMSMKFYITEAKLLIYPKSARKWSMYNREWPINLHM